MAGELRGIDVSRHQGSIFWPAVPADFVFAFLKATDGVRYAYTTWYHQNRLAAWQAGKIVGAYHFLLDHYHGGAQADFYVNTVNGSGGFHGVVPILDVEREADGTTPGIRHVREFVQQFRERVPGREILIYTGRWYWVGIIGNPHGADLGPLWHSEYDGISPIDFDVANGPELEQYGGWADALVWQHTSSGRVPGIAGACDLNLFYGSIDRLRQLAGLLDVAPIHDNGRSTRMFDTCVHPDGKRIDVVYIDDDRRVRHLWGADPSQLSDMRAAEVVAGQNGQPGYAKSVSCFWSAGEFVIIAQGLDDLMWTTRYGVWSSDFWQDWGQYPDAKIIAPGDNL